MQCVLKFEETCQVEDKRRRIRPKNDEQYLNFKSLKSRENLSDASGPDSSTVHQNFKNGFNGSHQCQVAIHYEGYDRLHKNLTSIYPKILLVRGVKDKL